MQSLRRSFRVPPGAVASALPSVLAPCLAAVVAAVVAAQLPCDRGGTVEPARAHVEEAREARHPAALAGLWTRWPTSRQDGDAVRFWFFHPEGIGLYRYGKIGLNTTNSFDWHVDGDELVVTFRKTGAVARTPYELRDDPARALVLARDPKEPSSVPYVFVPPPARAALTEDLEGFLDNVPHCPQADTPTASPVAGRLWIDQRTFATGGRGFLLYQLKDASIDGRGVGWHHIGDFDDWSTEALTFRMTADPSAPGAAHLELWFPIRQERATTTLTQSPASQPGSDAPAAHLTMHEDPRDFWHLHRYVDGGPSFGSLLHEAHGNPDNDRP